MRAAREPGVAGDAVAGGAAPDEEAEADAKSKTATIFVLLA